MQIASISAVLEYAMLILFFVMMAQMVVLTLPRAAACLNRAQQVLEIEPSIVDGERTLDDGRASPRRSRLRWLCSTTCRFALTMPTRTPCAT